jgi:hypothetical protein
MSEESRAPSELDTLFSPGLLEYRLAIQEKRSDQQEIRIRMIETQVIGMARDMETVSGNTADIKKALDKNADIAREAAARAGAANRNNVVSVAVAAVTVIGTVLFTHFFPH